MKKLFVIISALIFIASCTIQQEYYFHDDFSGTATTTIDMRMLMNTLKSLDTTGTTEDNSFQDSISDSFSETKEKLEELGFKNVKFIWFDDGNVFEMSYDFKDIESLNLSLNLDNGISSLAQMGDANNKGEFRVKRNTLYYDSPKIKADTAVSEMESMKSYYQYELIFRFDKEIKKSYNKNAEITATKKTVVLKGSLFDVFSAEFDSDMKIKLQK